MADGSTNNGVETNSDPVKFEQETETSRNSSLSEIDFNGSNSNRFQQQEQQQQQDKCRCSCYGNVEREKHFNDLLEERGSDNRNLLLQNKTTYDTEEIVNEKIDGNDTEDSETDFQQDLCRICYGNDDEEELLAPCKCLGTVEHIHESCLLTWLKSGATTCELCNTSYRFRRIVKPYSKRKWSNVSSRHIAWIVKELVLLDWFHFLETVLCCITLIMINRMASYDLVYQFALIFLFELFYYGLNIWSCFYLLAYERWASLNLEVRILNFSSDEVVRRDLFSMVVSGLESYKSLLKKNRRLRMVINSIEENELLAAPQVIQ